MSARALLLAGLVFAAPAGASERLIRVRVAHTFNIDDAKARTEMLLKYWGVRFGAVYVWDGNVALVTGRVLGVSMKGKLVVDREAVEAISSDPGPLLRGIGARYVERKLRKYLHAEYREP